MIISSARSFVFVHIPKTGGTALSLALETRAHKDDILIGDTPKAVMRRRRVKKLSARGRLWKHSTLADIEGVLPDGELASMFKLTLVRNPWDRMVSYYHWLKEQTFDHPAVRLAQATSFEVFVADPQTRAAMRRSPYGSYMTDSAGREQAALFVRLEAFSEDIAPFETHVGFRISMTRANTSERDPEFRGYYRNETRQIVAEDCAQDIARFGYQF